MLLCSHVDGVLVLAKTKRIPNRACFSLLMAASLSKALKLRHHRHLLSISQNPISKHSISALSTCESTLPPPPTPPQSTVAPSAKPQENRREGWSKWLLFLPGAITFGLGTWQLFRRQEKMEMLEYRRKRLDLEPVDWNKTTLVERDLDGLEFRKVVCEGVFDDSKSVYVGPRSRSISGVTENGFYVITPLILTMMSDSDSLQPPLLVNRGWVPRSWRNKPPEESVGVEKDIDTEESNAEDASAWWKFWSKKPKATKAKVPTITPVRVIGVIRSSEKPNIFVPGNDPKSGQWFYVDVPAIARACSLPENTIYIEDINEDASPIHPYPVPKDVNSLIHHSVMPQDHVNYSLTWYSLSAAVTFMAVKRINPKKTRR